MFFAIAIGIFGGGWLGYLLSSAIYRRIAATAHRPQIIQGAVIVGSLLIAFPSLLLSFVIGGTLGGSAGAAVLADLRAESFGAGLGVACGIGVTLALGLSLGALLGGLTGRIACGLSSRQS